MFSEAFAPRRASVFASALNGLPFALTFMPLASIFDSFMEIERKSFQLEYLHM